MRHHPVLQNLRIVTLSFAPVIVGGAIAVAALRNRWSGVDDGTATLGVWVSGALGVIGLATATRWRARVLEHTVRANELTTSYFITIAVAETSLLAGFVFTVVSHRITPFAVGAGLFAVAWLLILTTLGSVEIDPDTATAEVPR